MVEHTKDTGTKAGEKERISIYPCQNGFSLIIGNDHEYRKIPYVFNDVKQMLEWVYEYYK